jgi:pimeloyl-ACP methyl ester carboxylesterase
VNNSLSQLALALSLTAVGLLSATVIPTEELEANKPKLLPSQSGNNLMLDWATQPEVYYFVEGSLDLSTWIPAKLLKDTAETGNLSLGTAMGSTKGFYRLSLEGDPDSARLRADDDGDGIINILEADANMDAFETEASVDSEPDGIPDYWEKFHFGTLAHDASYVAVAGGLDLATAYASGTDPKQTDSDGDGFSDAFEIAQGGRDANYNESRDDSTSDYDNDGVSDALEIKRGTNPTLVDSDGDGKNDLKDAVGYDPYFSFDATTSDSSFVLIDLGILDLGESIKRINNNGTLVTENSIDDEITVRKLDGTEVIYDGEFIDLNNKDKVLYRSLIATSRWKTYIDETMWFEDVGPVSCRSSRSAFALTDDGNVSHYRSQSHLHSQISDLLANTGAIFHQGEEKEGASLTASIDEFRNESGNQATYYSNLDDALVLSIAQSGDSMVDETLFQKSVVMHNGDSAYGATLITEDRQTHGGSIVGDFSGYNFSDGTTLAAEEESLCALARISGQDGLWKIWEDQQGERVLSLSDSVTGKSLRNGSLSANQFGLSFTAENGLSIGGYKMWCNGRILSDQDILGSDSGWTELSITKVSDSGSFIAGTAQTGGIKHTVMLLKMDIAVDANKNGEVEFGSDQTEENEPYVFWVNNDADSASGEDPGSSTENHTDGQINGIRDLEDFTRLHIDVSSILPMLKDDSLDLALKFENTTGSPGIKLWAAKDADGGIGYLEDATIAQDHLSLGAPGVINGSTPHVIAQQYWDDLPDGTDTAYLLYEGSGVGKGELTLEIQSSGEALGDGPSVWLELRDIKTMYVRGKSDWPSNVDYPHEYAYPNVAPPEPNMSYTIDSMGHSFDAPWYETGETIVFVHGWNQPYENSIAFAETGFKRLWNRGFTGRYAMFRWPTFVGGLTYNDSDYRAWKSGQPLKQFVESLPGTKNIMAHSMGNIVASSALKQGLFVSNYALIHAAVPAACYDSNTGLNQWSYTTPDTEADLGFRGYLENVSGHLINFYLREDSALSLWATSNQLFKPQRYNAFTTGYYYDPNEVAGKRIGISFLTQIGRFVNRPHEAMAYVAQSQTLAVGAEGGTRGIISVYINLESYNYSDNTEHSGPWNYSIQEIYEFYDDLMDMFDLQ